MRSHLLKKIGENEELQNIHLYRLLHLPMELPLTALFILNVVSNYCLGLFRSKGLPLAFLVKAGLLVINLLVFI